MVFSEISAQFFEHSGQVLRSYTVGVEPTQLYRDLHAAADACYDAVTKVLRAGAKAGDVLEATRVVEDMGFTTIDDVLHGYGGGYFPPVIGSTTTRPIRSIPMRNSSRVSLSCFSPMSSPRIRKPACRREKCC